MGTLYLCPTPIGHLDDITYRTVRTLAAADLICAEDTRHSLRLLRHYNIERPLLSFHEHNSVQRIPQLLERLRGGEDIALITDAGTPAISDPGEDLVRAAIDAGIRVVPLPGAAAVITALIASGCSTRAFVFEGFLPTDNRNRRRILSRNAEEVRTMIFYEAPHRLQQTLEEMAEVFGAQRQVTLCREMTKAHEEFEYTTLGDASARYGERMPRGEYVLVVAGRSERALTEERYAAARRGDLSEDMRRHMDAGLTEKEAMKAVARERGVSKRAIYSEWKRR